MGRSFSAYVVLLTWLGFQFCSQRSLQASASIVTCQTSVPAGGTCDRTSNGCSADSLCPAPDYQIGGSYREDVESNDDMHKCPWSRSGPKCHGDPSRPTSIRLANISTELLPFDSGSFSINVSWTLASAGDGGYEVRLLQTERNGQNNRPITLRCLCINSQNYQNFNLRFVHYKYTGDFDMTVAVLPFPVPGNTPRDAIVKEVHFERPRSCGNIPAPVCDMSHYGQVHQNLTVQSSVCNDTKKLAISWAPPIVSPGRSTPLTYYVYIYRLGNSTAEHIFTVSNATGIVVGNLSALTDYSVQLELYGRCSARNLPSDYRSCGNRSSNEVEELASVCNAATPSLVPTPQPTLIVFAVKSTSFSLLLVLIPSFVIVMVVALLISLLIFRWCPSPRPPRPVRDTNQHPQVFVFYSSSTPQKEVTYIQEHIVCPLLQYFEVVTLNDCISGDLPVWIERMVEMSKSVLLVSNKEFCSQWSMEQEHRDPAVNSLRLIVSAAVAQNDVDKFGIVTSPMHTCIPFNSYLENFPVFVLSKSASKSKLEMEKIYQFVTRIPTFQFGTGTTPTTDGPANVAVLQAV